LNCTNLGLGKQWRRVPFERAGEWGREGKKKNGRGGGEYILLV